MMPTRAVPLNLPAIDGGPTWVILGILAVPDVSPQSIWVACLATETLVAEIAANAIPNLSGVAPHNKGPPRHAFELPFT